jgi:hypothetical protein
MLALTITLHDLLFALVVLAIICLAVWLWNRRRA